MDFPHVRSCFSEPYNVKFAEAIQIKLPYKAANVSCFEHCVWWIQEFLLKLCLKCMNRYIYNLVLPLKISKFIARSV